MTNPKIVVKNLWRDGELIAVSSENPQFLAEYTQDDSKQLFFRSAGVSGAITIDCDFGAESEYDFIALLNHNLTPNAAILLKGSDDSDFIPDPATEKITDGGFESWNSATDPQYWEEFKQGGSSVNRESTEKYSGTYACRLDIDADNNPAGVQQIISMIPGAQYQLSIRYKTAAGKTGAFRLYSTTEALQLQSDGSWTELPAYIELPASANWTQYTLSITAPAFYTSYIFMIGSLSAASSSIYVDAISIASTSDVVDTLTYRANDIFSFLPTARNKRYVRLEIIDTTNPSGYLQIGTIVVGKANQLNRRPSPGYQEGSINETEVEYSPSMNLFVVQERPSIENKILTFKGLDNASSDIVKSILLECAAHKGWIICLDPDNPNENTHWVRLKSISLPVCDYVGYWTWECEIEEIL